MNSESNQEKSKFASLLDEQLEEILRSKGVESQQASETIRELYFIRDKLELFSTVDALSVSAKIASLLLSEINKGGSIIVKYKSGVSSKLKIN